jgi:hypothetical protein
MSTKRQALIVVPLIISLLGTAFGVLGYFMGEALGKKLGDVDENNHFTSLGNCGRRFLCLGKRD